MYSVITSLPPNIKNLALNNPSEFKVQAQQLFEKHILQNLALNPAQLEKVKKLRELRNTYVTYPRESAPSFAAYEDVVREVIPAETYGNIQEVIAIVADSLLPYYALITEESLKLQQLQQERREGKRRWRKEKRK